jgi:hypothetical protein
MVVFELLHFILSHFTLFIVIYHLAGTIKTRGTGKIHVDVDAGKTMLVGWGAMQ